MVTLSETTEDLIKGDWYISTASDIYLFRYEGMNDDAYVFSKFKTRDGLNPGDLISTIEIYTLGPLVRLLSTPKESN